MNSRRREKHEARTCRFGKERAKNIIAMRTVEFNQAMSGREGAQSPPLPPAPPNLAHMCHCDVLLDINSKKGHF